MFTSDIDFGILHFDDKGFVLNNLENLEILKLQLTDKSKSINMQIQFDLTSTFQCHFK